MSQVATNFFLPRCNRECRLRKPEEAVRVERDIQGEIREKVAVLL